MTYKRTSWHHDITDDLTFSKRCVWLKGIHPHLSTLDLFGKVDTERGFGYLVELTEKCFLLPCPNNKRGATTFLPLIRRWILPGSIIYTDESLWEFPHLLVENAQHMRIFFFKVASFPWEHLKYNLEHYRNVIQISNRKKYISKLLMFVESLFSNLSSWLNSGEIHFVPNEIRLS